MIWTISTLPESDTLKKRKLFFSFLFAIFLCISFVKTTPFSLREDVFIEETGSGDFLRQISYLLIVLLFLNELFKDKLYELYKHIGLPLCMFFAWSLLSCFWSEVPFTSFRRIIYSAILVVTVSSAIITLGPKLCLKILIYVLGGLVFLSFVSGFIIPGALHQIADQGSIDLIGNWRGVFIHKNKAGEATALFLILITAFYLEYKKFYYIVLFLIGSAFIILTVSKTSIVLVPVAIILGCLLSLFLSIKNGKKIIYSIVAFSVALSLVMVLGYIDVVVSFFENPDSLTGRAAIWEALYYAIEERPLTGQGFGSVYLVGYDSVLLKYGTLFMTTLGDGHNGYIDIVVNIGIVGLLFFVIFLIKDVWGSFNKLNLDFKLNYLVSSIVVFVLIQNVSESNFIFQERSPWIIFLIVWSTIKHLTLYQERYGLIPKEEIKSENLR